MSLALMLRAEFDGQKRGTKASAASIPISAWKLDGNLVNGGDDTKGHPADAAAVEVRHRGAGQRSRRFTVYKDGAVPREQEAIG